MGLKPLLAVLLVSTLALAGCSGGDGGGGSTATTTSSSTGTSTAPNRAPTASLEASAVNGTAPLNVTFTLDGHDADKDNLTWTLTVSSGNTTTGATLPANVTLAFAKGNHTVTLTVSDGRLDGTASVNVTVTDSGATVAPAPLGHFEGSAAAPCVLCPQAYGLCGDLAAGQNEVQCFILQLPEGSAGRTAVFTNSNGPVSADFMPACEAGADGTDYFVDEASPHEFEVPEGVTCVVVYDTATPDAAFTVDIL